MICRLIRQYDLCKWKASGWRAAAITQASTAAKSLRKYSSRRATPCTAAFQRKSGRNSIFEATGQTAARTRLTNRPFANFFGTLSKPTDNIMKQIIIYGIYVIEKLFKLRSISWKRFSKISFEFLAQISGKGTDKITIFASCVAKSTNLLSPAKAPLINRRSTISIDVSPPLPSPLFIFPLVLARSREGLSLHVHRGTNLGRARLVPLSPPPPISRSAIIRVNPRVARKSPHLNHAAISQLVVLGCSRRSIINYRDHSNDQRGRGGLSSLIQFSANRRGCVERCGVTEPRENSRAYYRLGRLLG